jgi:hypothetical protein
MNTDIKKFKYASIFLSAILLSVLSLSVIRADSHNASTLDFDFFPKFVHYQGTVAVAGQKLENIDTGIANLKVEFISQTQNVQINGVNTPLAEGAFKFSTIFGADIPGKYHIDIGPGVPGKVIFDVYVGGIKATESITFLPTAADGCRLSNCMNATFNLTADTIPRPTPTPIPPTPTPLPTVNPSLYSGQIAIGSGNVPDGIEVYAKIQDYISETVTTKDGGYSITVNPITINYVNQPIKLVIQGNESISSVPFQENQFITGVNFLFADFELKVSEPTPIPIPPTPTPLPTPKPETIIVVATPTPSKIEPIAKVEQEPVAPVAEGGGCSDGGGSSSISLFSVFILGLLVILSKRFRKPILARIRL